MNIPAEKILGKDINGPEDGVRRVSFTSVGRKVPVDVETSCHTK